jgi:hypothetical protein
MNAVPHDAAAPRAGRGPGARSQRVLARVRRAAVGLRALPAGRARGAGDAERSSPRLHVRSRPTGSRRVTKPGLGPDDVRLTGRMLDLGSEGVRPHRRGRGRVRPEAHELRPLPGNLPDAARIDAVTRFEKEMGVPALRTAGLMLVHRNRQAMLKKKLAASKQQNDAAEDHSRRPGIGARAGALGGRRPARLPHRHLGRRDRCLALALPALGHLRPRRRPHRERCPRRRRRFDSPRRVRPTTPATST